MLNSVSFEIGDSADGMLVLGARHANVDPLRAHGLELGSGLGRHRRRGRSRRQRGAA